MSDEDELFSSLVGDDVKPIKVEKRVNLNIDREDHVDKEKRRENAEARQALADPLSTLPLKMVDPLDVLSFKRSGVQHGVFKNLRQAKYQIDARLDLHRMNVEAARLAVYHFIVDCVANDIRMALITHGKGLGRDNPAMLKSCVAHWLPEMQDVLAFHTAQKHHGGYGATYVLLKKSASKRQEAKEKNTKKQEK